MPNVTVLGVSGSVVTIPVNSNAAAIAAQTALNVISAAIVAGTVSPDLFTGSASSGATPAQLQFSGVPPESTTVPSSSSFVSLVSNSTALTSITTADTDAVTVVSGSGGLNYTQTAPTVVGSLIVTGGGASNINLAAGYNTVSVDVTAPTASPNSMAVGSATVLAATGHQLVIVNATTNDAMTSNNALVVAAGHDTIVMAGSGAIWLEDTTNTVSVISGGAAFLSNGAGTQPSTNIFLGTGDETIGVLTGSVETLLGAAGGGAIFIAGGAGVRGTLFINPAAQNVTVSASAGATTLFGTGDAGATSAATGSDVVLGGIGYFHAGSGGGSLLESAPNITGPATTLIGGGINDALFAQSTNVSLKGGTGTQLIAASGATIAGGFINLGAVTATATAGELFAVGGAAGGATLNAGSSNAMIFGATSGGNTIISGSGTSTVYGHAGVFSGAGNIYLDGGGGGVMSIIDFTASDSFRLGAATVVSVTGSNAGTLVTLSDGTKVAVLDGLVTSSNVGTYFHS